MKYFYAYVDTDAQYAEMITVVNQMQPEILNSDIYIDINSNEKWNQLVQAISYQDEVYCYDMSAMAGDGNILFENLSLLLKQGITLKLVDDMCLDIKQLTILIEFVRNTQRKLIYEKQMEGIHKALEKKRNGIGDYGRPKIILPSDFEANIRKIMKKEMKHEDYREQLGFKRSTYFKFVKDLKDSWKQQELERSLCKNGKD